MLCKYLLIFTLIMIALVACEENNTIEAGEYRVNVLGKSGKISLNRGKNNLMQIQADKLEEKTANNETAGNHILQTFAKTDFIFSKPNRIKKYGLNATSIYFNTTFTGDMSGEMNVEVILFEESGNITVESGEEYNVNVGAIKFNIEIKNYKFCNPCQKGNKDYIGKFLDFTMELKGTASGKPEKSKIQKGKSGRSNAKKEPETYNLGDSEVILSTLVRVDGNWKNMSDGYPLLEQQGSRSLFTFRFENFTSNTFYDPIGQDATTNTTTAAPVTTPSSSEPSNKTINTGIYSIDIVGRSGKIKLKKNNDIILQITPDKLEELTSNNTTAHDHILQNFAKTDFTVTSPISQKKYNLNVTVVSFITKLTDNIVGTINIDVIVFNQAGNITVESGEEYSVNTGAVKFNIEIRNYTFCDPCRKGNQDLYGSFLDLTLELKGTKTDKPNKSQNQKGNKGKSYTKNPPETYDLGGSEVILSSLVKVDGEWKNMTDGYPSLAYDNGKTSFIFRFGKFNSSVYYDPVGQDSNVSPPTPSTTPSPSNSIIMKQNVIVFILTAIMLLICL